MTVAEALAFVRTHGVVLESGPGPVPSLASAIVGAPIRGSWWGHAMSHEIFALTRAVSDCPDVLVCRLIGGKVTFVHRRLWPALVCVAARFPPERLAQVSEKHTAAGRHVKGVVPFLDWVSPEVDSAARRLDEPSALAALGTWCAKSASAAARDADEGAR